MTDIPSSPWAKMGCGHAVSFAYADNDPQQPWRCARCDLLSAQVQLARTEARVDELEASLERVCQRAGELEQQLHRARRWAAAWKAIAKRTRARWLRLAQRNMF